MLLTSPSSAEPPNVLPPIPPKPSPNKFIRGLQERAWQKEPFMRMRLYLEAVTQRFLVTYESNIFDSKKYIHWSTDLNNPNIYKFDVMNKDNYNEAASKSLILIDSDMTDKANGIEVFVYKDEEARDYCQSNLIIEDLVQIPTELQNAIEVIKKTPFPEYKEPAPDTKTITLPSGKKAVLRQG